MGFGSGHCPRYCHHGRRPLGKCSFYIALSVVVATMVVAYAGWAARTIRVKFALSRVAILMLASHTLFYAGKGLVAFAAVIRIGTTRSVEAIKMSTKLTVGRTLEEDDVTWEAARPRCGG